VVRGPQFEKRCPRGNVSGTHLCYWPDSVRGTGSSARAGFTVKLAKLNFRAPHLHGPLPSPWVEP
jgi:hypothetical protein